MRRRRPEISGSWVGLFALLMLTCAGLWGCNDGLSDEDRRTLQTPKVEAFFNSTGTRRGNAGDLKPDDFLIERIDHAQSTIDVAAYGFEHQGIADALIRAYERGVDLRFVGDPTHLSDYGYEQMLDRHIPMQVGNEYSIMHLKTFIIDGRFVFTGTGNITPTGFGRNNNNWVWMESEPLARDFTEEFEQMFQGEFSAAKESTNSINTYQIGDTTVEAYFSPQEQAMDRLLHEVRSVDTSIHFQIFAFTKNEVGGAFVRKHRQLMEANRQAAQNGNLDPDWEQQSPRSWPKKVTGVLDRSQVHGNGQYHEGYRMSAFGIPMRYDANDNSVQPGDYQAGGGRLHTKTMILDAGTEDARVITGSFNWSSSATTSNDEIMLILRGEEITDRFMSMFDNIWNNSRPLSDGLCYYLEPPRARCGDEVNPGDVVISEVHWDGWNGRVDPSDHTGALEDRDLVSNDEFLELYNTTDEPIDMSMWTVTNGQDFVLGFPPGTTIMPGEYFLVADHNLEPYSENRPQRGTHAFTEPDFTLNTANDPRFPRLNLKNASLHLELRNVARSLEQPAIDVVGDNGTPYAGGRELTCSGSSCQVEANYSMERTIPESGPVPDGTDPSSWSAATRMPDLMTHIAEPYRDIIVATPGMQNSSSASSGQQ